MIRYAKKPSKCTLKKLESISHSLMKTIANEVNSLVQQKMPEGSKILNTALAESNQCNLNLQDKKDRQAFHKCIAAVQKKAINDLIVLRHKPSMK